MNRSILLSMLFFFLTGCLSVAGYKWEPKTFEAAEEMIAYSPDEFEGGGWLKSEPVTNMTYGNAIYHLRANLDESSDVNFIQIYVNLRLSNWLFVRDVAIKSEDAELVQIDTNVFDGGYVHENVAVTISKETLVRMANNETLIKLKGKKGNYIFSVNKNIAGAFLKQLDLHTKLPA